jgi:hypothetical protein
LPHQRASDAERELAVEALREATADGRLTVAELELRLTAAYDARTRNELETLLADVKPGGLVSAAKPGAVADPGAGAAAAPRTRWIVSVMSGHDRRGRWRVGSRCNVINVMGGSALDLNDAELTAGRTEIRVISVMGGCEIRVPEGLDVLVSEFGIMGGNDVRLGAGLPASSGPQLHLRLISVMGGSSVRRGRKRK